MSSIVEAGDKVSDRCSQRIIKIARYFQIEELVRTSVLDEDPAIVACESEASQKLRQETH